MHIVLPAEAWKKLEELKKRIVLSVVLNIMHCHSSSVLIVHPSAERFRLPEMSHGKLNANTRHYSLDSPSLTSPPGYGGGLVDTNHLMLDQKPPVANSMMPAMSLPSTSMPLGSSSNPQFHSFNTPLVMAPAAPPGLLHLGKKKSQKLKSKQV